MGNPRSWARKWHSTGPIRSRGHWECSFLVCLREKGIGLVTSQHHPSAGTLSHRLVSTPGKAALSRTGLSGRRQCGEGRQPLRLADARPCVEQGFNWNRESLISALPQQKGLLAKPLSSIPFPFCSVQSPLLPSSSFTKLLSNLLST